MSLDIPGGWESDEVDDESDLAVVEVYRAFKSADPSGRRLGSLMRRTLDQLYDGQRTGRYSWHQLHKTERTHFGTLFEINLRREFRDIIEEGRKLDYRVAGHDVDCKFSQRMGGWMIPPEAFDHILVVGYVNDFDAEFAFGVVRASTANRRVASNRDAKVQLSPQGNAAIRWVVRPGELPPNILLRCDETTIRAIFGPKSGQQRVNELFRRVTRRRIGRNVVATVAQQDDYMKRVRENGGARTALRPEGYVILGGDYALHREVAAGLGVVVPEPGELVSVRVVPASESDANYVMLEGGLWRAAYETDNSVHEAPIVPYK